MGGLLDGATLFSFWAWFPVGQGGSPATPDALGDALSDALSDALALTKASGNLFGRCPQGVVEGFRTFFQGSL